MHDKAHERFKKLDSTDKDQFFSKLASFYKISEFKEFKGSISKPALLVSSSSWTEDEDFHLLIDALQSQEFLI